MARGKYLPISRKTVIVDQYKFDLNLEIMKNKKE
jgi:hypothetical protein